MKITILTDDLNSWAIPYVKELYNILQNKGHNVKLIYQHKDVGKGDILFLLSCTKLFKKLNMNTHNIVVHSSDLPKGKGWSPITWQVLEGKKIIPCTLFEAVEKVDAGKIYLKDEIILENTDLLDEIKDKQGKKINEMIIKFIDNYDILIKNGIKQNGKETFYPRRNAKDSELDINKSIKEQFNLLRVCDNKRYPAFFVINNTKYILNIIKEK